MVYRRYIIFTVTTCTTQSVFNCTLSVCVAALKPIYDHWRLVSWNGDFIGLPDLIVRSCAFTSVIISLELHLMVVSLFEAHTVSTSDSEFLLLTCNLFIYMYYVYYLWANPLLPVSREWEMQFCTLKVWFDRLSAWCKEKLQLYVTTVLIFTT